jgi:hypothetical protein
MRRIYSILSIHTIIILALASISLAGDVTPGNGIAGGEFGVVYECAFPNTVVVDGKLNDDAWQYAPWHTISNEDGTSPAPDSADATCSFAAVADNEWLYVALKLTDDTIVSGETDTWEDDSIEIYIDANHARTETYENDDAQITIGAGNIGGDINAPHLTGSANGPNSGTIAGVAEAIGGWVVEAAVPLNNDFWNIVPQDGLVIGFNIHFNDDDDGDTRDHKLIWSLLDVDDQSWQNTSRFADLEFVNFALAVEPMDKLSRTWGQIKTW